MRIPTALVRAVRRFSGRQRFESDMADELRFHVETRAADLQRRGLTPDAARRQARIEFGGVEGYKEVCRDEGGFRWLDEVSADLRYGARSLRHSPTFALMTVLSLALGIGVNLSCFSAFSAMVLHPFPYPELDRILMIAETRANASSNSEAVAPANYLDWRRQAHSFEAMAAFKEWDVNLTGVDRPDHIRAAQVTGEFFRVLGSSAELGRSFSELECQSGRDGVVVVSHDFWHTRMNGSAGAVGSSISLGGRRYQIIGVMSSQLNLPLATELWAPLAFTSEEEQDRAGQRFAVIGKVKSGIPAAQANSELNAVAQRLEALYSRTNEQRRVRVVPLAELMEKETGHFLTVLMCAALFVLLLACTNVASLQVARAMSRQKEIGLRYALGAGAFRICRQFIVEAVLVGIASGAAGLVLATFDLQAIRSRIPPMVYRITAGAAHIELTPALAAAGILLAVGVSALCAVPALVQVLKMRQSKGVNEVLKEGGRTSNASPGRSRVRFALVVSEVALAFVLLIGAGLMASTLQRMVTRDFGYRPQNVVAANITLTGNSYDTPAKLNNYSERLLHELQGTPGVTAVALGTKIGVAATVAIQGRPESRPGELRPSLHVVTPQYLDTLRIPLLQGRWIAAQDSPDRPAVVVLSQSMAHQYWGDRDPVGEQIRLGPALPWMTVIGVAGDTKEWFNGHSIARAYFSAQQFPRHDLRLMIRASQDPQRLAGVMRAAARTVDREQPLYNLQTLEEELAEETSGVRSSATLLRQYALIALILAFTGIYSISSFFVTQRTREIGVRISLGATRMKILSMVLTQSCGLAAAGLVIGVPAAAFLAFGMSRALFGIVQVQPAAFVLFVAVLGAAAALAGAIPAYRAAKVDPVTALRSE